MNLCINCKYFDTQIMYIDRCTHPLSSTDPVHGKPEPARLMRISYGKCKPSGLLFEQKPPAPKKTPWYYGILQ